jgi:uncharacterized membrane protein
MAANNAYLFVGTNLSTQAARVDKRDWNVTAVGGFSPPLTVAAITANSYGYVTVAFGGPGEEFTGLYIFGPTGAVVQDGGDAGFLLNDINAVIPVALP